MIRRRSLSAGQPAKCVSSVSALPWRKSDAWWYVGQRTISRTAQAGVSRRERTPEKASENKTDEVQQQVNGYLL